MNGFSIYKADPLLKEFNWFFEDLNERINKAERHLTKEAKNLSEYATSHNFYGLHIENGSWVFREWAPNATNIFLIGNFSNWEKREENALKSIENGNWEITKPLNFFSHKDLYRLVIEWDGGEGHRIPSYAKRVIQDEHTKIFNAQVWNPTNPYKWEIKDFKINKDSPLFIYEAHIGMAQEEGKIGTYKEFKENILPRIIDSNYNTIQLMAILEHPYYGSFGYQVSNFFAPSSRFGTPCELKELIDEAHKSGINVLLDLVHSHAVKNEVEGLSRFDGTIYQYFHDRGDKSSHPVWDSRLFNYDNDKVLHFLLSNIRYWIEEFKFDGFRFDGVTSMIYKDHGIGRDFGNYNDYFSDNIDKGALTYLGLACKTAHEIKEDSILIAEDVSGFPGLASSRESGGVGFDYRLSMGVPDYWTKLIKREKDENWDVQGMFYELSNRRNEEKVISYAESHDQALVGDQAFIFRLIGDKMYDNMHISKRDIMVDRGISLHRLIRLITISLAGHGYLNFIGNEFGHPEWIDFPREGNNWSYHYARRRWSLRDDKDLYYNKLGDFDRDMVYMIKENKVLSKPWPYMTYVHKDNQVLSFTRNEVTFVFNFNPSNSYADYSIPLMSKGKYQLILNTDSLKYGGLNRIEENQLFETIEDESEEKEQDKKRKYEIKVYLPTRSALVLKKIK